MGYGPWGRKDSDMTERLHFTIIIIYGFPGGSMVKNPPANAGDTRDVGLIPGSEDPLEKENDNPLQYSCLGIPWREEAAGLQSMESQRVGHNACKFNSLSLLLNGKGKLNI